MSHDDTDLDRTLDRALEEIRLEEPDPRRLEAAAGRVLDRLRREGAAGGEAPIDGCDGFRSLLTDLDAGRLSEERRLLVEDHLRECPRCRRARRAGRGTPLPPHPRVRSRSGWRRPGLRIAAAAAVVAIAALAAIRLGPRLGAGGGTAGRVTAVEGRLFEVAGARLVPLEAGAALPAGRPIRTAKGSGALVTLGDGSRVELRERSELAVEPGWTGPTLRLGRGAVLVAAAPRHRGHLTVRTPDCKVGVTGTLFSVSHGTKGSRVSVVQGEVRVRRAAGTAVLHGGDQLSTSEAVLPVPLAEEVAWSRFLDERLAALRDLASLRRELAAVPLPPARRGSALAELLPEDTVAYAGLPNLSGTLRESYAVLRKELRSAGTLGGWWSEAIGPERERKLDELVGRLAAFGETLGDEIGIALAARAGGGVGGPLILAEVRDADALRERLAAEIEALGASAGADVPIRLLDSPGEAGARKGALDVVVSDGLLVASPEPDLLRGVLAARKSGERPFRDRPLWRRLQSFYAEGAEWIVAVDAGRIIRSGAELDEGARRALALLGIDRIEHAVASRRHEGGATFDRVLVTFDAPRHGVVSWLAPPAPIGSLRFVSPEAHLVVAAALEDPERMLDDLTAWGGGEPGPGALARTLLAASGIDVAREIAGPLGGEFTFALDGPLLPAPAWIAAVEVYDPETLIRALEALADKLGRMVEIGDRRLVEFERAEPVLGRPAFVLRIAAPRLDLDLALTDGYLLVAPTRGGLERAIRQEESGISLADDPDFLARLPRDRYADVSALVYHDLGRALASLAGSTARRSGRPLTGEERAALDDLARAAGPVLAVAYGFEDRIEIAITGRSLFGAGLADVLPDLTGAGLVRWREGGDGR
ncbi:MAG: hypothetical protein D6718_01530 [Acidobacteria bacterium]|nr:MAG: hypothetical protein D6718_01530 [Acidobacteriota bacterium]